MLISVLLVYLPTPNRVWKYDTEKLSDFCPDGNQNKRNKIGMSRTNDCDELDLIFIRV